MTVEEVKKVLATRYLSKYYILSLSELVCIQGNRKYYVEISLDYLSSNPDHCKIEYKRR